MADVNSTCEFSATKEVMSRVLSSPPKAFKAHYDELGQQVVTRIEEIGTGLSTPIN